MTGIFGQLCNKLLNKQANFFVAFNRSLRYRKNRLKTKNHCAGLKFNLTMSVQSGGEQGRTGGLVRVTVILTNMDEKPEIF